ncbi:MAG: hypothetical protein KDB00_28695, partial [Planctomycetales bacterium]|nr:hypothetical protein [Planctomycetales bacterium]
NLTTQRRLLITMTAGCMAAAVGSVVWSISDIEESTQRPAKLLADRQNGAEAADGAMQSIADDESGQANLSMPLLKPLYDAPKPDPPKTRVAPKVVPPPTPPQPKVVRLDWTLDGTIIDPDRSVAILTDETGKTDIRAVGEVVELSPPGVLVRKIDSETVTLEVRGKESTLRLKQSFAGGSSDDPDRQNRRRNR